MIFSSGYHYFFKEETHACDLIFLYNKGMKIINFVKFSIFLLAFLSCSLLYAYYSSPTDIEIVELIQTKMTLYEDINELDVFVNCHDGAVSFVGTVENKDQAFQLFDIARSTPGVESIDMSRLTYGWPLTE